MCSLGEVVESSDGKSTGKVTWGLFPLLIVSSFLSAEASQCFLSELLLGVGRALCWLCNLCNVSSGHCFFSLCAFSAFSSGEQEEWKQKMQWVMPVCREKACVYLCRSPASFYTSEYFESDMNVLEMKGSSMFSLRMNLLCSGGDIA